MMNAVTEARRITKEELLRSYQKRRKEREKKVDREFSGYMADACLKTRKLAYRAKRQGSRYEYF
ncbi:MAG: hypothetical protein K0M69_00560 [Youngiibacter sp.]|nr:hypothetical protein [Youngiibacter sp.]